MTRSAVRLAAVAAALVVLALTPVLAGAAGDPPRTGTGGGSPAPATKGSSGLPSSNPGDIGTKPRPDLHVSAMGYTGGPFIFAIRNQGTAVAPSTRWRMSCQLDPNQPASCGATFKPSENAGPLTVCPGFASLSPVEGVVPALQAGQAYNGSVPKPFKAGCRYKITVEADAGKQAGESNEGNNVNSYILVAK